MDQQFGFWVVALLAIAILGVHGQDECKTDVDCNYRSDYGSWGSWSSDYDYDIRDSCCNGRCRIVCPSEVIIWMLIAMLPCAALCVCVGAIAFIAYKFYQANKKKDNDPKGLAGVENPVLEASPPYNAFTWQPAIIEEDNKGPNGV